LWRGGCPGNDPFMDASPIVVGVDGSTAAQRALRWAAAESVVWGVGLDVLHAWETPYPLYPQEIFADLAPFEEAAHALLDDAVESLVPPEPVPVAVRSVLVEDSAATALIRAAASAELLVVGMRGRGGFAALRLGSVSHKCVQHAACSVAVVPPAWSRDDHGRVVVGVDGSEPSRVALAWALAEASRRRAELVVLHAVDHGQLVTPFGPTLEVDRDELEKSSQLLLEEMLRDLSPGDDNPPIEIVPATVGAARALLEAAHDADLLVVGARGRGGFRGLLLGSVSRQCVDYAPCPVVVVRAHPADR
jgi:nucleotide-binding universal stress UspA family protein